jgi:hypothetical protein
MKQMGDLRAVLLDFEKGGLFSCVIRYNKVVTKLAIRASNR